MDEQTIRIYNQRAADIAAHQRSISDTQVHRLALQYFRPGGATADIGSGSGRDVAWLTAQGFPAIGYEPSAGMRAEARQAYPAIDMREGVLPDLEAIADGAFLNVLCNAVLMHLPSDALPVALQTFARIFQPSGRLIISYRASRAPDEREADGRLFAHIDPAVLDELLRHAGLQPLTATTEPDAEREGITWRALVAEKAAR